MYPCMCVYMHVSMHVCMYVFILCMFVCMHVCLYGCTYACMHACMFVCLCVYVCVHLYLRLPLPLLFISWMSSMWPMWSNGDAHLLSQPSMASRASICTTGSPLSAFTRTCCGAQRAPTDPNGCLPPVCCCFQFHRSDGGYIWFVVAKQRAHLSPTDLQASALVMPNMGAGRKREDFSWQRQETGRL